MDNKQNISTKTSVELKNVEEVELNFDDLLILSTGKDENGIPNSTAILSIEELVDGEKLKRRKEVVIDEGSFGYAIEGGCAVIEIVFDKQNTNQYKRVCDICDAWITNADSKEYENRLISLVIMPRVVEGQLVINLEGLVYYLGIAESDESRVILCFDNNRTNIFETDIDYKEIQKQVELEIYSEEKELDIKIAETENEIKRLEEENYYDQNISNIVDIDFKNDVNNDDLFVNKKYGMRISESNDAEKENNIESEE